MSYQLLFTLDAGGAVEGRLEAAWPFVPSPGDCLDFTPDATLAPLAWCLATVDEPRYFSVREQRWHVYLATAGDELVTARGRAAWRAAGFDVPEPERDREPPWKEVGDGR